MVSGDLDQQSKSSVFRMLMQQLTICLIWIDIYPQNNIFETLGWVRLMNGNQSLSKGYLNISFYVIELS